MTIRKFIRDEVFIVRAQRTASTAEEKGAAVLQAFRSPFQASATVPSLKSANSSPASAGAVYPNSTLPGTRASVWAPSGAI